jgi:hypothetical protein
MALYVGGTVLSGGGSSLETFRNKIVNGTMDVSQRAQSANSISNSTSTFHTLDRWKLKTLQGGTWGMEQKKLEDYTQQTLGSTDIIPLGSGLKSSLKITCETAEASLASYSYTTLHYALEGRDLQDLSYGTSTPSDSTLSFWVKSNVTGTYIVFFNNTDYAGGISQSYTINSANTWEQKEITIPGDSARKYRDDVNKSLTIDFYVAYGNQSGALNTSWNTVSSSQKATGQVNLAGTVNNEFWLTGVQYEKGSSKTDIEILPYGVNLQRCQRYYHKESNGSNFIGYMQLSSSSNNYRQKTVYFPVKMRSVPSLTFSVSTGTGGNDAGTEYACNVYTNNGDTSTTTHLQSLTASAEL